MLGTNLKAKAGAHAMLQNPRPFTSILIKSGCNNGERGGERCLLG
jgi:hypothetical protein